MIHVPYRHKTISRLGKWKAMKKCKLMILHLTRLCRKRCLLENCQVQPAILGLRPGCEDRRFVKHFVCPNFDLWTNKQTKQKQYAPQIKSGDIQFGLSRGWILRPWLLQHLLFVYEARGCRTRSSQYAYCPWTLVWPYYGDTLSGMPSRGHTCASYSYIRLIWRAKDQKANRADVTSCTRPWCLTPFHILYMHFLARFLVLQDGLYNKHDEQLSPRTLKNKESTTYIYHVLMFSFLRHFYISQRYI